MADERWFYRDDADGAAIAGRLKVTPCPHCRAVGTLNRHGTLTGYDDAGPGRAVRGRRVFCSHRGRRPGCGRTTTVWAAGTIRRLSLTARTVGRFLQRAVAGTLAAATRDTDGSRSDRTFRRVWRRFVPGQSRIRTALFDRGPPPDPGPVEPSRRSTAAAHVLAHLRATFPSVDCPVTAYQQATRTFFA